MTNALAKVIESGGAAAGVLAFFTFGIILIVCITLYNVVDLLTRKK